MSVFATLQSRGFVQQHTEGAPALIDGPPISVYAGFDPTSDSLHVGHLFPAMALAHLQRAGHRIIAVVGGGTAMVGDPSGKDEARQLITTEQIELNKVGIRAQLSQVLNLDGERGLLVDNQDWLCSLNYIQFLRDIGRHFSVNTMLSKASVKLRLEKGLSFIEFNYQLLQAYDFLELNRRYGCNLQLGGDDQWGNITAGIDLIRRVEGREAEGFTQPLLLSASGAKMGKTAAGAVWLGAHRLAPYDYFQYWMNVEDADVGRLLRIFTFLELDEIAALAALEGAEIREAKRRLAYEATKIMHGEAEAKAALDAALAVFGGGGAAGSAPERAVSLPKPLVDVLVDVGLCASKSDARRQIQQGAVKLGPKRETNVSDIAATLGPDDLDASGGVMIWRGKKDVVRVIPA
ncbi:tyrosine--tRNA ligase [Myxococcota bacterium]|nr:tyrosine--tRNA ligase [Myxococcota bacterium]